MKDITQLTPADLREYPVWRFADSDAACETSVRPLKILPAKSLSGSVLGCDVRLACGQIRMALLSNIDIENAALSLHFVTISIFREDGEIFHLARYHDFDADRRGPDALAKFLGMTKEEIFPIDWDVRQWVCGTPSALQGRIETNPKERLTRAEIIALAVP